MTVNPEHLCKILKAQPPTEPPSPALLATGLATRTCRMSHDQVLAWLLKERALVAKDALVANFLTGVERNQAYLRAALSAFACATHLQQHSFTAQDQLTCQICSFFKERDINFIALNRVRFLVGAALSGSIANIAFLLQEHNAGPKEQPGSLDLMRSILELIRDVPPATKPKDLLKLLRKLPGIKMSEEEGRGFLDLLGHCGILQTPEHPGLLYRYINFGLAPRSARSSDWSYPVDFWRGEHGLNEDALNYWFADYPALLKA
ncbi:hypothetical protein [Pseudomonas maumuensis]|uniref:Uncharacterized protein n=1 Tax=Pseudomonas maumuensis TaxID=2842354 RepID=A0ABX8NK50_9PSED|nr:hypothetical protein [Pseudomonas maumuensis]QXH56389.1 hypothetical protein KSS90_24215 [Pseudomonas maumuensis]